MYWNALSYIEVADVAVLFFLQITISDLCTVTTLMPMVSFVIVLLTLLLFMIMMENMLLFATLTYIISFHIYHFQECYAVVGPEKRMIHYGHFDNSFQFSREI